jgi:hypothetical protein
MIFPRSFAGIKVVLLGFYLLINVLPVLRGTVQINSRIITFYLVVAAIGGVWAIVGLINSGSMVGVLESVRLYVFWSVIYFVIIQSLRWDKSQALLNIHYAIVISGIAIPIINLAGVFDLYAQTGYIGEGLQKELDMFVGFHDEYVQITSHNIGSLFFITGYLLTLQFVKVANGLNGAASKFSLLLCILIAVLSGRRALWLAILLVPIIVLGVAVLSKCTEILRRQGHALLHLYLFLTIIGVVFVFVLSDGLLSGGALNYINSAFSAEDERTIQRSYLMEKFIESPIFGTGFAVGAGYVRNDERPWLYELTYYQMLFNFGLVGVFLIVGVFFRYMVAAFSVINQWRSVSVFSITVGLVAFLVGAYSNPYLGSFDFLLYLGMLPLVASYEKNRSMGVDLAGGS